MTKSTLWFAHPIELLQHASGHLRTASPFDCRIAHISIDNAIETALRTYLSLPASMRGSPGPTRNELEEDGRSFSDLLDLTLEYTPTVLDEISPLELEYYHRLRNQLYHEGAGITVAAAEVTAYMSHAKLIVRRCARHDFAEYESRLAHLRDEVKLRVREELLRQQRQQHSERVKAGLREAEKSGRLGKRGAPIIGMNQDEIALAVALFRAGTGYRAIANEIVRRRKAAGKRGAALELPFQQVGKTLRKLGLSR